MTLSAEARQRLLATARAAIAARLQGRPHDLPDEPRADVQGAFVTLRRRADGELRGCVGTLRPSTTSLTRLVAETACASALHDHRFEALALGELGALRIEVSILGPLTPARPEEIEVGRHGVVIRSLGRHGLLLPQVALEHGWDREALLEWTCRKAGLEKEAWRDPRCELSRFTAEVFGES